MLNIFWVGHISLNVAPFYWPNIRTLGVNESVPKLGTVWLLEETKKETKMVCRFILPSAASN